MHETAWIGLHYLYGRTQRVGHVHHVHVCARFEGTFELLAFDSRVIDVYGIVCGAASGRCRIGNKARESNRACVDAETFCIIVAQKLAADFCDAVDGIRTLDGILRCLYVRSAMPERSYGTRGEYGTAVFSCHFESVEKTSYSDRPCELRFGFGYSREKGGEIVDCVDIVFLYDIGDLLWIGYVDNFSGTALGKYPFGRCGGNISTHHVAVAIDAS